MEFSTRLPSLQHIALVHIAYSLWKKSSIASGECPLSMENFKGIVETDIQRMTNMLPLPNLLTFMLANIYKNMNWDLFAWFKYHSEIFSHTFQTITPNVIMSWTADGYIDRKKTARTLIRNININISERYKLACIYCFEDDIPILYNEILENDRISLLNPHDYSYEFVIYWSHKMHKGECINHSACTNPIIYAALRGNLFAIEYFLHQLSPENRKEILVVLAEWVVIRRNEDAYDDNMFKGHYSDVLCFLISQMSVNQFKELLRLNHYDVLHSFLDWPWQVFLMKVLKQFPGCLSDEDYLCVLKRIVFKFKNNCKDFDYRKLYKQFWHEIPTVSKRCLLNNFGNSILLSLSNKMKLAFHPETFELQNEQS